MPRPLCLVTGASAGIGRAFAEAYARRGHDLVLTARRAERLEALAAALRTHHGVAVQVIVEDLAAEGAVSRIAAALDAAGSSPDVLVNNAGYGLPGAFLASDRAAQRAVLRVMLESPVELVHALAPAMVARRHGTIVNVSSAAGMVPGTGGHTLYPAVKAALTRFSEGLHVELAPHGVRVCALCPGFTYSEFHDVNGTRTELSRVPRALWLDARTVAEAGIAAAGRDEAVCVPGVWKGIIALTRLVPEGLIRAGVQRQARRLGRF